jgi:hypothetical protein
LVLGAIAIVSVASAVGTLVVLGGEKDPATEASPERAPAVVASVDEKAGPPPVAGASDASSSGTEKPVPLPSVGEVAPVPPGAAEPGGEVVVVPPSAGEAGNEEPEVEETVEVEETEEIVDEPEITEDASDDPASKRPQYLTKACADRRERARSAFVARKWKDVLSATSVAACWSVAEQGDRRSMRVMAYQDLGEFKKCVATGRGAKDKQTQTAVKICAEQLKK